MILRRAVAGDVAELDLLEQRLFSVHNYPLSRRSFAYHVRHSLLLVARSETGALAGYALALVRRRRKAKLYSLGVAPEFRGQKVARALIARMIDELGLLGFGHTELEVRCDNDAAIALYRALGFETCKRLEAFYRDGCDAYLMEASHACTSLHHTV